MSRLHLTVNSNGSVTSTLVEADKRISGEVTARDLLADPTDEFSLVFSFHVVWHEVPLQPFVNIEIPDFTQLRVNGHRVIKSP